MKFHTSGVLAGLGEYYQQKPQKTESYNLKDLLYNLPYIHRAYIMTYTDKPELFIPIYNPRFVYNPYRNETSITSFEKYYPKIRKNIDYIYSPNELWYLKRNDLNNSSIIDKNTLIITMGAMHRLSELARYYSLTLKSHLEKEQGWLLREFINKSIVQFIDAISSEITGDDFRQKGFRN